MRRRILVAGGGRRLLDCQVSDLARVVTYDERMRAAAQAVGCQVTAPS